MTAKDLKNALLQEAIQGKIVPQIATEGNARELLEQIRKESIANGHRIYSIELDEINKASERFQGLSDAAEKSADRATKTPHVDNLNITQTSEKSREEQK